MHCFHSQVYSSIILNDFLQMLTKMSAHYFTVGAEEAHLLLDIFNDLVVNKKLLKPY